jgi:hypothetical protein
MSSQLNVIERFKALKVKYSKRLGPPAAFRKRIPRGLMPVLNSVWIDDTELWTFEYSTGDPVES